MDKQELTTSVTPLIAVLSAHRVTCGPFVGMEYDTEAIHAAHLPKLLGCCEQELHACLERFLQRQYQHVSLSHCLTGGAK